jgi:hypothetical protein
VQRPSAWKSLVALLAALLAVGVTLSPVLFGFLEPVGGDPDQLYRPIKAELARAYRGGHLPFWSDRFGLGVPLLAESHAAAFYPLNWPAYRLLPAPAASRVLMWLHYVALAGTTYLYARRLKLSDWGSALAGVAFSLCGFQAAHACHEPLYQVLVYLPLALVLADLYAESGRLLWLALLALAWGVQLTLGHFHVQFMTAGLVLICGAWRVVSDRKPVWRLAGLAGAVMWGALIADVQLAPTRELARVSGFSRPFSFLLAYSFPIEHWAQPILPEFFSGLRGGPNGSYWSSLGTTGTEACFFLGTIPLVFASIGMVAAPRLRGLGPWLGIAGAGFALAVLPRVWPDAYWLVTLLPGFGLFRGPGRYTVLSSLGLSLLAARGLDRSIARERFRAGLVIAVILLAAAAAWVVYWWAMRPSYRLEVGDGGLVVRITLGALAWLVSLAAVTAWRAGRLGGPTLLLLTALELAAHYYLSQPFWMRPVSYPSASPITERLRKEPDVGLVTGQGRDLVVRADLTAAYPYLGLVPPPPNYLLEPFTTKPGLSGDRVSMRWLRRFGVSHGIWDDSEDAPGAEVLISGPDPALDAIENAWTGTIRPRRWKLVRYRQPLPRVWVATREVIKPDWPSLYSDLCQSDATGEAWYLEEDRPREGRGPRARVAVVISSSDRNAVVSHDGDCDLIVRRTWYPGWTVRVNDGPALPVAKANAGLQAVRLVGSGVSRVSFRYEPTGWRGAFRISLIATIAAVATAVAASCGPLGLRWSSGVNRNRTG